MDIPSLALWIGGIVLALAMIWAIVAILILKLFTASWRDIFTAFDADDEPRFPRRPRTRRRRPSDDDDHFDHGWTDK